MRMVRAAGQMAGQTVLQRLLRRQQRAAYRPHGALRQLRAPGQAEPAQLVAAHLAAAVARDIIGVMGQSQDVAAAK